jgi:spermidine synthase
MCQGHLKEGGVLYYNTTRSEDSVFTAAKVFKSVTTYGRFVATSDRPFAAASEERRQSLLKFQVNGRAKLDGRDTALRTVLEEMTASDLLDQAEEIRGRADLQVVTDDNMLTEFKTTHSKIARLYRWYDPAKAWNRFHRFAASQDG